MRRRIVVSVALALFTWLASAGAQAAGEDVDKQVQKLNKRAMEDYDALEFESARRTLLDAIQMLRANGIDDTPTAAKTYLNLGIIYINGFKDRNRGQQQIVNALKINPSIKIDPTVATPETDEAYAAASKQVAKMGIKPKPAPPQNNEPTPPTPEPTPPTPTPPTGGEDVHGLVHNPVDESRPNSPVPVRAKLGGDVGAAKVFLFYRGSGQEDFVSQPMKNTSGAEWVGVIPPDAVAGKSLQYYLEARDARGRAVVGAGSTMNPFIIAISDTAAPPTNVPEVDVEDPLMRERAAQRRRADERKSNHHHLFVLVMPGFGFGVESQGSSTEVAWQFQKVSQTYVPQPIGATGVTIAPFHIAAEIGYAITSHWMVSLMGRFQVVTAANAETVRSPGDMVQAPTSKAFGAVAGLARLRYRFLNGKFHPYIHADIGGGEIRHTLDVSSANTTDFPLVDKYTADQWNGGNKSVAKQVVCKDPKNCSDTIVHGLFLVGGGAGLWYDIGSHLAFIFDFNLLFPIGTGGRTTGNNFDFAIGLGAHFL